MKRFSVLMMFVFLLTACGLGVEDVSTDGLTNAVGDTESQSVVMSGGSTMIQKYYKESGATGGLFSTVADIVSCEVVFEPNDQNGRIFMQLQPKGESAIFGKDAPPQFGGGGLLAQLNVTDATFKEPFRTSCEGSVGLTAVPIKTTNGPIIWLASTDLSNAVWKAPAGMEVSEFFSENGYRSLMLMTTNEKVDVPQTAVAKAYDLNPNDLNAYDLNPNDLFFAYDLNPNDLNVTDPNCAGLLNTSDADIGPIFRGIMFETLIGTSSMLVLGDGNTLGKLQAGTFPFVCDDSSKVQMRSTDLGVGDKGFYHLAELRYPEMTLQTADGEKDTVADVTVLGLVIAPKLASP